MAIAAGADLVLELPFPCAAGSARYFATAGVRALGSLGCDTLLFGSESADKAALLTAAARLLDPVLIEKCEERTPKIGDAAAHFGALGDTPASNDILAMEYTRAILAEDLPIEIAPVLRMGDAYRADAVHTAYPSATALRKMLGTGAILPSFCRRQHTISSPLRGKGTVLPIRHALAAPCWPFCAESILLQMWQMRGADCYPILQNRHTGRPIMPHFVVRRRPSVTQTGASVARCCICFRG
jgi:hypothetical protein